MFKRNLQKLISILESSSINNIEISSFWGFRKIKLGKDQETHSKGNISTEINSKINNIEDFSRSAQNTDDVKLNDAISISQQPPEVLSEETLKILSPLVGTFYLSPKPGSPPFISEGDRIEIGQTLCIVEAMKIFNEIESEYEGKIIKILVEDGTPIEYDQPLIILKK